MPGLKGILKDPLLSVVMPVYNERATIEEMIARVVAVPGIRMELIVVDDGSPGRHQPDPAGAPEAIRLQAASEGERREGVGAAAGLHR